MNVARSFFRKLAVFPALFCVSCTTSTKTNVEDYLDLVKEIRTNFDFHTQLVVFPETIEGTEIVKYLYQVTEDSLFGNSYFFYLVLSYEEEGYQKELERLNNAKAQYKNGVIKPVLAYPEQNAFLSIMKDNRYEYVLYNSKDFEICYISNQLYQWNELTILEEKHYMPEFRIPKEYDDGANSYNLYYYYEGGVGYELGWDL